MHINFYFLDIVTVHGNVSKSEVIGEIHMHLIAECLFMLHAKMYTLAKL